MSKANSPPRSQGSVIEVTDQVARHLITVLRPIARRHARDIDHADDLLQECVARILEQRSSFNPDEGSFDSWARVVAWRHCVTLGKRDSAGPTSQALRDVDIADPGPLPDEDLLRNLQTRALRRGVATLPKRERLAIELVHLSDRTQQSAANVMGVSTATLRQALRRAMAKLKGMPDLISSRDTRPLTQPPHESARHCPMVLALVTSADVRQRVRAGAGCGTIHHLIRGVRFAQNWRHLGGMVDTAPGCPVVVDPDVQTSGGPDSDRALASLVNRSGGSLICHVDPDGGWATKHLGPESPKKTFETVLRLGLDDTPDKIRRAILQATARGYTMQLIARVLRKTPQEAHVFLTTLIDVSLEYRTVAALAKELKRRPQALSSQCRRYRWPTPKRLISLAAIFHVERLTRWSGRERGPVALAMGFSDTANYTRLVRNTIKMTPTEVGRNGGQRFMADLMLQCLRAEPERANAPEAVTHFF